MPESVQSSEIFRKARVRLDFAQLVIDINPLLSVATRKDLRATFFRYGS